MKVLQYFRTNAPSILTGAALASTILGVASAIWATPKAFSVVEEYNKKGEENVPQLIKGVLPYYIPTILFTTVACSGMLSSNAISINREQKLLGSVAVLSTVLQNYKDGVRQADPESAKDVRGHIISNYKGEPEGFGDTLFYEEYTGKFFRSTLKEVEAAEYEMNKKFMQEGYINMNYFYQLLGLEITPAAECLSWTMAYGNDDGCNRIEVDNWIMNDYHVGEPIYYIEFLDQPSWDGY